LQSTEEVTPATVPTTIAVTTARPDAFIVRDRKITVLELTMPWNSSQSIQEAGTRKQRKVNYQYLASDLTSQGYTVQILTLEIMCLGHMTKRPTPPSKLLPPYAKL
jgi:hypothetical protein